MTDNNKGPSPTAWLCWQIFVWVAGIIIAGMVLRDCANSYGEGGGRDCTQLGNGAEWGYDC